MNKKSDFPLKFNGKYYQEKDCDDTFLCFFDGKVTLGNGGGVYVSDGLWIYPDGSTQEF